MQRLPDIEAGKPGQDQLADDASDCAISTAKSGRYEQRDAMQTIAAGSHNHDLGHLNVRPAFRNQLHGFIGTARLREQETLSHLAAHLAE